MSVDLELLDPARWQAARDIAEGAAPLAVIAASEYARTRQVPIYLVEREAKDEPPGRLCTRTPSCGSFSSTRELSGAYSVKSAARRTRILYLLPTLAAGGTERQAMELVRHIDRTKFDPIVVTIYDPETVPIEIPAGR